MSSVPSPPPPAHRRQFKPLSLAKASNIPVLGRTNFVAHAQSVAAQAPPPPATKPLSKFPLLAIFESERRWTWIWQYLRTSLGGKFKPYPTYPSDGASGVFQLRAREAVNPIRLSIVGDWGTGTYESSQVAQQMQAFAPDYTIHLGDVYYVGDQPEVDENFLGAPASDGPYTPLSFPRGSVGTFALPGNHEMYGGGRPYFTTMLKYCVTDGASQQASFFSLESEHWRILGLDTGYNSVGTPILGSLPLIKKIPWFSANCGLQKELLSWLETNVNPRQNRKPTMLLSHHQYFSAYPDEAFRCTAQQIKDLFAGQELVWIWGHEHRLSIYDKFSPDGNLTCYGRCLGHGGMPVERSTGYFLSKAPLAYFDPRKDYPVGDGSNAGYNGFLNATLHGPTLTLEYRDLHNTLVFSESFTGNPDGILQHSIDTTAPPILQHT
jgi:hypothetical protein